MGPEPEKAKLLTPSRVGPAHGLRLRSRVSKHALYFCKTNVGSTGQRRNKGKITNQGFGKSDKGLNIKLVFAQVQHLQCAIAFQYLSDISYSSLELCYPLGQNLEIRPNELTLRSFPLRSNVLNAPTRGKLSSARTLSKSAALGPASCRGLAWSPLDRCVLVTGLTGCLVVTPPCDEDVIIGIGCPLADHGLVLGAIVGTWPRRDLGT